MASNNDKSTKRQALASSGVISALSSMLPGMLGNALPMAFLFGLGALLVPALGLGLLLREGRRR